MILYFCIAVAFYLALSIQGFPAFANDPGVGWHLKTGEYVLQHGVPQVDPFLAGQRTWISDQWLSDVALFLMQKHFGWEGAYLVLTALFMGCFLVVLFDATLKFDGNGKINPAMTALGVTLALIICSRAAMMHFIFRPVIFSFFLFAIVFRQLLLIVDRQQVAKKEYLLFIFLFALWANLHPSFVLGVLLVGLAIVSIIIGKFFLSEGSHGGQWLMAPASFTASLVFLFLISCAATLANPYGFDLHVSILQLGNSDYFMKLNNEWHPLKIDATEGQVVTFVVATLIFWFAIAGRLSGAIVFTLVAQQFFIYQALISIRFLPYFAIVTTPLLALAYSELHSRFFKAGLFSFSGREKALFALLFVPIITMLCFQGRLIGAPHSPLGIPTLQGAVNAIEQHANTLPASVYNHPNYGGRLAYYCGNVCTPLLDDRNTLLGEEVYKEFLGIKTWDQARALSQQHKATFFLTTSKLLPSGNNPLKEIYGEEEFKVFLVE